MKAKRVLFISLFALMLLFSYSMLFGCSCSNTQQHDHDYGDLVTAKSAACTDDGYSAYYHCRGK